MEFRSLYWMRNETWSLLKEYNVAYTNVDEPLLPPEVHLTADFAYFRWHERGERPWFDYLYEKAELDEWVPKVEEAAKNVKKVYGYFNNHFHGYAPENCLYLIEKLGLLSEEQKRAKEKAASKQSQLGSFSDKNAIKVHCKLRDIQLIILLSRALIISVICPRTSVLVCLAL